MFIRDEDLALGASAGRHATLTYDQLADAFGSAVSQGTVFNGLTSLGALRESNGDLVVDHAGSIYLRYKTDSAQVVGCRLQTQDTLSHLTGGMRTLGAELVHRSADTDAAEAVRATIAHIEQRISALRTPCDLDVKEDLTKVLAERADRLLSSTERLSASGDWS